MHVDKEKIQYTHLHTYRLDMTDNTTRTIDIIQHEIVSQECNPNTVRIRNKPPVHWSWELMFMAVGFALCVGGIGRQGRAEYRVRLDREGHLGDET